MADKADDLVRDQYENYPYPIRDPKDESSRLVILPQEYLPRINHHLFRGRQAFGPDFRALVAGGGTGDHAIFLAEQLRELGGKVVYVDLSQASRSVAEARAKARDLSNIEFYSYPIEEIDEARFGLFDYVTCTGVLHHLVDPSHGLRAIRGVLAPGGGMGLMVYATYGRDGLYQLQSLLRTLCPAGAMSSDDRIEMTLSIIEQLPASHRFFRGGDPKEQLRMFRKDPVEVFDALLHSRDRSYTVPQLYEFLDGAGLHLVDFTPYSDARPIHASAYDPLIHFKGEPLARARTLSLRERHSMAEAFDGNIDLHTFYVSPTEGTIVEFSDDDVVPFFMLPQNRLKREGNQLLLTDRSGFTSKLPYSEGAWMALALIDGQRSMGEIVKTMEQVLGSQSPGLHVLKAGILPCFEQLALYDWLLGRHKSLPAFKSYDHLYFGD